MLGIPKRPGLPSYAEGVVSSVEPGGNDTFFFPDCVPKYNSHITEKNE